ncbi:MAG: mismatch repair enzyme MutH [Anaerocolumna sp.]|jgi:hypothetical protein|nr:mismatch repair enzyme MutH [Anaerocolumna sp.]
MLSYDYIKADRRSILEHAKKLESHVIGDVYDLELNGKHRDDILEYYSEEKITGTLEATDENGQIIIPATKGDKGRIGNLVQEIYFDIPRNNISDYDIEEAKVELKVSKLVNKPRAGLTVKERLVLGMISANESLPERFEESHIYNKCKLMMLIYYINQEDEGKRPYEFPFYRSAYIQVPDSDIEQIRIDYEYIRNCVNSNCYEDLTESRAMYLSPCPKNGRRAFSFKPSYMNQLFREYINTDIMMYDPYTDSNITESASEFDSVIQNSAVLKEKSFEEIVLEKFAPHIGLTVYEIRKSLLTEVDYNAWFTERARRKENTERKIKQKKGLQYDGDIEVNLPGEDKAEEARTTYMMLGIRSNEAEEFVKANICVKSLHINKKGVINEKMVFPAFEFTELLNETWEESQCYQDMYESRFLFAIYKETDDGYVFKGVKFWSMSKDDMEIMHQGWEDIRSIIKEGVKFKLAQKKDGSYNKTTRGQYVVVNNFPDSKNTKANCPDTLLRQERPLNPILSIRPHTSQVYYDLKSINYRDTTNPRFNGSKLPNGDIMTKQSFWYNIDYIKTQILEFL